MELCGEGQHIIKERTRLRQASKHAFLFATKRGDIQSGGKRQENGRQQQDNNAQNKRRMPNLGNTELAELLAERANESIQVRLLGSALDLLQPFGMLCGEICEHP